MTIVVRRFAANEWATYRDLRLRALSDSPQAFSSILDRETTRSDDEWRDRLARAANSDRQLPLIALLDDAPVGLAWSRIDDREPDVAHLLQVWVAPEARGRGIGRQLVEAAVTWARNTGLRVLRLGVTRTDSSAVRLYVHAGFVDTGVPEPLRPGSPLLSQPMQLVLRASTGEASA
jgi:ribosomal protein S18 acetylase RimI-like enzyme